MNSGNTVPPAPLHQTNAAPSPEDRAPGNGERLEPVEARSASRVGLWKILSISLVLAIAGIALISALSA